MKKIFSLCILILTLCLGSSCFASVTMTESMAQEILDFTSENLSATIKDTSQINYLQNAKTFISTITAENFANTFNSKFNLSYTGEYDFKNLILITYYSYTDGKIWLTFEFRLANNGYHDEIPYLAIREGNGTSSLGLYSLYPTGGTSNPSTGSYLVGTKLVYRQGSSTLGGSSADNNSTELYTVEKDFYNINEEENTIYMKSILALDGSPTVYFRGLNDTEYFSYTLTTSLNPAEIPDSGDIENPSGDNGESGDTGGESSGDNDNNVNDFSDVLNYPKVVEYPLGLWNGEPLDYKVFHKFLEFTVEANSCWMHFDKYTIISGDLVYVSSLKFNPFITENYNFDIFTYEFNALSYNSNSFFDNNGVYIYFPYLRSNWGSGLYPEYSYKCTYFFTPSARLALMGENPNDYFENLPDFNYPQFDSSTNNFNDLINDTTAWVTNIFGFMYIFPPWFVSCIVGAITVVVICRILGR